MNNVKISRLQCLLVMSAVLTATWTTACNDPPPKPPEPKTTSSSAARPVHQGFPFKNVTASSGLNFAHNNRATDLRRFPETMGPGLALFDADGDDDPDLYVVSGGANRLFFNRGDGSFEAAPPETSASDDGFGMGVAVADYDGDGDLDLYVLNYGPNVLYRNLGDGRFEAVRTVGAEDPSWSVGGAFLDYDADGDLDLYVVNYLEYNMDNAAPCRAGTLTIYCSPERFPPAADRLFRNDTEDNGAGRFTDVTREAGINANGRGMGLAVSDLDGDGDPDVVVANDRSQNQLYRNTGGRFEEIGAELGVGYGETGQLEGGMGVVVADLTGSGRAAIFQTNFQKEPNRFFVSDGKGFFDDHSLRSGLGFPSHERVSWGIGDLDIEGDGDLDLAVANGHVYDNAADFVAGSSYAMADQVFINDGKGQFLAHDFPGQAHSSRGLVRGDIDGDGDDDLVVASCGGPLTVWRNEAGHPERFLKITLRGSGRNTRALGARLVAEIGTRLMHREVTGGGSYASRSDTSLSLGLGEAPNAQRLKVRWPDGSAEEVTDVQGGQAVVWRQGEGIVSRRALSGGELSGGGTP